MSSDVPEHLKIPSDKKDPLQQTSYEGQQQDLGNTFSAVTKSAQNNEAHESILAPAHSEEHEKSWGLGAYIKKGLAIITEDAAYYHYGNYVVNRKTQEKTFEQMPIYLRVGMHLLYCGSIQESMLEGSYAQRLFLSESINMGKTFDSPESKSKIAGFVKEFNLDLGDLAIQDIEKYENFNQFFARGLKPGARPISEPENDNCISSAADCRLVVFDNIDLARQYWVKGRNFTIATLINDEHLAGAYEGGAIAIFRLAPQDYHRWHTPISGTMTKITNTGHSLFSVNPMIVNEELDVFTENKRSIALVQTRHSKTPVAVVAVGAMLVGSIEWTVSEGQEIKRGQEMGLFKYGGSTVITVFPADYGIKFDGDLCKNSMAAMETQVSVGERIGECRPGQL